MKQHYNIKQMRRIIADCVWSLRRAYAENDKTEFKYQLHQMGSFFVIGFISRGAYRRAMQMYYEIV